MLVRLGANEKPQDRDGEGPLLRVSTAELARLLIAKGAGVNRAGKNGLTALHNAVFKSDVALTRLLLENGADPNARDADSHLTPLDWLVVDRFDDRVGELLLRHGASVDEALAGEHGRLEALQPFREKARGAKRAPLPHSGR